MIRTNIKSVSRKRDTVTAGRNQSFYLNATAIELREDSKVIKRFTRKTILGIFTTNGYINAQHFFNKQSKWRI